MQVFNEITLAIQKCFVELLELGLLHKGESEKLVDGLESLVQVLTLPIHQAK